MRTRFAIRPLHVKTSELLNISDREGRTVMCLEGSVWITRSNDTRDVVLIAGQTFVLDKSGLALVCAAAGPANLAIEKPLLLHPPPLPPYFWDMRNAGRHLLSALAGL